MYLTKKATHLILTLTVLCLCTSFAEVQGQDRGEDALMRQIQLSDRNRPFENQVLVKQTGLQNEATILQVRARYSGVETLQAGVANSIQLNQAGGKSSIIINQFGAGNTYAGDIEGQNLSMDVLQVGLYNSIKESSKMNNTDITIIQEGSRNEIVQTGDMSNASGIRIHQVGNGAKLTIKSN